MKSLAISLFLLAGLLSNASAQSITIASISSTVLCSGDSIDVSYSASGTFTDRNSFTIQLSDKDGSFDKSFYNLGSKRTTTSGVVRVRVRDLEASTNYRLRAISSEPYAVGVSSSASLSIAPMPIAFATVADLRYPGLFPVMLNDTVRFLNASQYATTFSWTFGPDAIPSTSTEKNPLVRFTTPGPKRATMIANSPNGCSDAWASDDGSYGGAEVVVVSCFPSIPRSARVDSTSAMEPRTNGDVWIVPGGVAGSHEGSVTYYVEPGGSVQVSSENNVCYLKAGAAYDAGNAISTAIVYEAGAGMRDVSDEYLFKCDNLEFDYSDAPPYKINQASVSRIKGSTVQVYPNPTTNRLTIEHADNLIREISIRNTLGAEQLFMQPEGLGKTTVDVSGLAAGLYFLDLITDRGIEIHKIVVSR